jgi:hypothetical protein
MIGYEQIPEGKRNPEKEQKNTKSDPEASISYSECIQNYPCAALMMLVMRLMKLANIMIVWLSLIKPTFRLWIYGVSSES